MIKMVPGQQIRRKISKLLWRLLPLARLTARHSREAALSDVRTSPCFKLPGGEPAACVKFLNCKYFYFCDLQDLM